MLGKILSLTEEALVADTAAAASRSFHAVVSRLGASYLQTRNYRRPTAQLTSATHWAAGGFVARYARPGWAGSAAFNFICFECNPLLEPIRTGRTRYRFGDYAPHSDKSYGSYWDALSEAGISEALCATAYGADRRVATLHIGFPDVRIDAELASAVQNGAMMLAEKLLLFELDPADRDAISPLTARERDSLAFVAEGKTDWEIAQILGISEATARFHVDNARRKLDAVNRAHAVARFLALNGPF